MPNTYALLDADARSWWHHESLRAEGRTAEAREHERRSIRESVRSLRRMTKAGGYWTRGRGGDTLYVTANERCENVHAGHLAAVQHLGFPGIDSRTIPDSLIFTTVALPMPTVRNATADAPPWGSMSTAPFYVVASLYALLGATVTYPAASLLSLDEILPDLTPATAHKLTAALASDGKYQPGPNALRRQIMDECEEMGGELGAEIARQMLGG